MRELYRDPDVMRDILKRRMLRGACSAISWLVAAQCGLTERTSDDQFRAAAVLARLAPALVGDAKPVEVDLWMQPQWWTPHKIMLSESLFGDDSTREEWSSWWAECFRQNGAQPPNYTTLAEARAYGRKRFDQCKGKWDHSDRDLIDRALQAFEDGEVLP